MNLSYFISLIRNLTSKGQSTESKVQSVASFGRVASTSSAGKKVAEKMPSREKRKARKARKAAEKQQALAAETANAQVNEQVIVDTEQVIVDNEQPTAETEQQTNETE